VSVRLTLRTYLELLYVDLIHLRGFRALQRAVSRTPVRSTEPAASTVTDVLDALTWACALYFKQPRCVQRSAVVTRLLRRRGVPAQMLIGCHPTPFRGHAWVEVGGNVICDRLDGLEHFLILDRW
jgi:prolyl oligopeptidase